MSCKKISFGLLNTQIYSHLLPAGKGRLRGEKTEERTVKINSTETSLVYTFDNVPVICKHGKDGCTDTGCDYELRDLLLQSAPSETLLALTSAQRYSKSGLICAVATLIF